MRTPLAGGPSVAIVDDLHSPTSLAVDNGALYWADLDTSSIGRVMLATMQVQRNLVSLPRSTGLSAIEFAHHRLYFTVCEEGRRWIGSSAPDGSTLNPHQIALGRGPCAVGLAASGRYLYWTNGGGEDEPYIGRITRDGRSRNNHWLNTHALLPPGDLAVTRAFLYWQAGARPGWIGRARFDSTHSMLHFARSDGPLATST